VDRVPEEWARDAVASILDQFPIVRRRDEERHGRYPTKEIILAAYDELIEECRRGEINGV
jgi:hypothetical protein